MLTFAHLDSQCFSTYPRLVNAGLGSPQPQAIETTQNYLKKKRPWGKAVKKQTTI
jgi:hypothetical protein